MLCIHYKRKLVHTLRFAYDVHQVSCVKVDIPVFCASACLFLLSSFTSLTVFDMSHRLVQHAAALELIHLHNFIFFKVNIPFIT